MTDGSSRVITSKGVTEVSKVYVTRMLSESALSRLDGAVEWDINPDDRVLDRAELLAAVAPCSRCRLLRPESTNQFVFCVVFLLYGVG